MKVTQSRPTLCDPMDYTVHRILQAIILQWVAVPFSRGSSQPRDWTQVSHTAGGFFTSWATGKPSGKEPAANGGDERLQLNPWIGKIPWTRAWQPTPVSLSGKSHRERSLEGYSSWGRKELDLSEVTKHTHMYICAHIYALLYECVHMCTCHIKQSSV